MIEFKDLKQSVDVVDKTVKPKTEIVAEKKTVNMPAVIAPACFIKGRIESGDDVIIMKQCGDENIREINGVVVHRKRQRVYAADGSSDASGKRPTRVPVLVPSVVSSRGIL